MQCDIIIPAYNSATVLPGTLAAIAEQQLPLEHAVNIIIADDGSTDDTVSAARQLKSQIQYPITILSSDHAGPAAARNRALDHVTGDLILLLGADIRLLAGALATHLLWHEQHTDSLQAALGWVKWDPALAPTQLMEWLVHGGPQNNYDALLGKATADPQHFFNGAHLSLKSQVLATERFSSSFDSYGWEDLELGRRLGQHGLQLHVLEQAQALHHHFYSAAAVTVRQQAAGRSLRQYQRLHPRVSLLPKRASWHRGAHALIAGSGVLAMLRLLSRWCAPRVVAPRLFSLVATLDLWTGIYSSE